MSPRQPKSQKTATEQAENQPIAESLTEHEVTKKNLKKTINSKRRQYD